MHREISEKQLTDIDDQTQSWVGGHANRPYVNA